MNQAYTLKNIPTNSENRNETSALNKMKEVKCLETYSNFNNRF